ncbi:glycosyltransferase family 39 protein [candidate division WOR-3 bacterium]|nr:glycosyltransferase family 39 protein [candidate division WOR-3 bacterium]
MTRKKIKNNQDNKKNLFSRIIREGKRRKYVFIALIFSLALILRLINIFIIDDNPYFENPIMDELYHDQWAQEIASGDLLSRTPFYRAPAYIFLLGLIYKIFSHNYFIARLIGCIFGALNCVLIYILAKKLFNTGIGIASGIIACFYSMLIYFDSSLLTVFLEIFFYLLGLIWFIKAIEEPSKLSWFLSGIFFGIGAITRPNILVFIVFAAISPFIFLKKIKITGRFKYAGIFTLAVLTIVGMITLVNIISGNDFVLIAWNGGINFFLGNNELSNGWSATNPIIRQTWWGGYNDAIIIAEKNVGHDLRPSEVSAYWFKQSFNYIINNFGNWLKLIMRKIYLFSNNYEISNNQSIQYIHNHSFLLRIPFIKFAFLISFGLCGAIATIGRDKKRLILFLYMFLYSASIIIFFVNARYRMPIIPVLIIFSVSGIHWLFQQIKFRKKKEIFLFGTFFVILILLSFSDFYNTHNPNMSQVHFSLGNQYIKERDFNKAIHEFELSIEINPINIYAWNNLASALIQQKRYEEAYEALQMSLRYSENPTAYSRMGVIMIQLKNFKKAESVLNKAIKVNSQDPEGYYYLAFLKAQLGETEEALIILDECINLNPDPRYLISIFFLKGQIHFYRGEKDKAIGYLKKAEGLPKAKALLEEIKSQK